MSRKAEAIRTDEQSEKEIFELYYINRDVEIRNRLVSRYMYLADIISKKFTNRGVDCDDTYQVACVAPINADRKSTRLNSSH